MSRFEKHQREYTLVGATAVFASLVSQDFIDFYGGSYKIFSLIKNGIFWHYEVPEERLGAARKFLQKVGRGEISLDKILEQFELEVNRYLKFINQPEDDFSLSTILEFFIYYHKLIGPAVATFDPVEVLNELPEEKRKFFLSWSEKARKTEEPIFKNGETVFVPKYLNWLQKNYLFDYTNEQLKFLFFFELVDFLRINKPLPNLEILEQRKNMCCVCQYPVGQIEHYCGIDAKNFVKKMKLEDTTNTLADTNVLTGTSVFGGLVSGRVRLISKRMDMDNFRAGEIIVSPMTEPGYLPIMHKAIAIVTDEGGVLCHAAIVSRELNIPCIVGTKVATEVLKDGDMVEVDANSGVIRKI